MTFAKTELGQEVLKTKFIALSPRQRAMLIISDGRKNEAELLALTSGLGATPEDLQALVSQGLIMRMVPAKPAVRPKAVARPAPSAPAPAATPEPADYVKAYKAGVALTSKLGLRGFRLNLAMESAADVEELRTLYPQVLEAMEKAHGTTMARQMVQEFHHTLGLR